jgi:uncharacterized protein (TIGR02246 family)
MKKLKLIYQVVIILLIALTAYSCLQKEKEPAIETEKKAINEVLNQFAVTINDGDFDKWISLWSENGIQMPPESPSRNGKAEIIDAMKPLFDQFFVEITIKLQETKVYGNLGLTRCTYSVAITPKEGGDKIIAVPDGKALTLYEKQGDAIWKIVYDCFNSNIPTNID